MRVRFASTSEIVNCDHQYDGAYWVKTRSREAFAWQGEHVVSKATPPGVPSLLKWPNPQPPVVPYLLASLTMNWTFVEGPATKDCERPKTWLLPSDET